MMKVPIAVIMEPINTAQANHGSVVEMELQPIQAPGAVRLGVRVQLVVVVKLLIVWSGAPAVRSVFMMATVASVYIVYIPPEDKQTSVRNAILTTQMSIVILGSFVQRTTIRAFRLFVLVQTNTNWIYIFLTVMATIATNWKRWTTQQHALLNTGVHMPINLNSLHQGCVLQILIQLTVPIQFAQEKTTVYLHPFEV